MDKRLAELTGTILTHGSHHKDIFYTKYHNEEIN